MTEQEDIAIEDLDLNIEGLEDAEDDASRLNILKRQVESKTTLLESDTSAK